MMSNTTPVKAVTTNEVKMKRPALYLIMMAIGPPLLILSSVVLGFYELIKAADGFATAKFNQREIYKAAKTSLLLTATQRERGMSCLMLDLPGGGNDTNIIANVKAHQSATRVALDNWVAVNDDEQIVAQVLGRINHIQNAVLNLEITSYEALIAFNNLNRDLVNRMFYINMDTRNNKHGMKQISATLLAYRLLSWSQEFSGRHRAAGSAVLATNKRAVLSSAVLIYEWNQTHTYYMDLAKRSMSIETEEAMDAKFRGIETQIRALEVARVRIYVQAGIWSAERATAYLIQNYDIHFNTSDAFSVHGGTQWAFNWFYEMTDYINVVADTGKLLWEEINAELESLVQESELVLTLVVVLVVSLLLLVPLLVVFYVLYRGQIIKLSATKKQIAELVKQIEAMVSAVAPIMGRIAETPKLLSNLSVADQDKLKKAIIKVRSDNQPWGR